MKRIFFSSTILTSFIREDIALLEKHFEIDHVITRGPWAIVTIIRHVARCEFTYTWFASVYSFFVVLCARIMGKRSFIVIGGVDASREPSINYGIWLSWWKSFFVRKAMINAHKLLVVDPFFVDEVRRLAEYDGANIVYVPTGYDATYWSPAGDKERSVLTVAACHDRGRMRKKGLDVLFKVAREMPDVPFRVIGIMEHLVKDVRYEVPVNVEIIPFTGKPVLLQYYRKAKVYCQPSFTEGLPNSLCEAMLCECIPVGSNAGGIPTAIGDTGDLVAYGDVEALVSAISRALESPPEKGKAARDRIKRHFTLERRETELLNLFNEVAT